MSLQGDLYVEIPGSKDVMFDLPPLCLSTEKINPVDIIGEAEKMIESDCLFDSSILLNEISYDTAKISLATNLIDRYSSFLEKWDKGNAVLDWVEHCKYAFQFHPCLRNLMNPSLWPHAGKNSFVKLLEDKDVSDVRGAVGYRLLFRRKPRIGILTSDFLFYLSDDSAGAAFSQWEDRIPKPVAKLPPERFNFQVIKM